MQRNSITVDLTFEPSFCNQWPKLVLEANGKEVWQDFITHESVVTVAFPSEDLNKFRIKYINKRNGPDIWDTKSDQDGNIVEDQHVILTNLRINQARCDWLINKLPWNYSNGLQKENFGFMDLQGFMDIEFPRDVYGWIIQQRKTMAPASDKQSALDYKGIYLPQHETKISFELIEEIKGIIKQINV